MTNPLSLLPPSPDKTFEITVSENQTREAFRQSILKAVKAKNLDALDTCFRSNDTFVELFKMDCRFDKILENILNDSSDKERFDAALLLVEKLTQYKCSSLFSEICEVACTE